MFGDFDFKKKNLAVLVFYPYSARRHSSTPSVRAGFSPQRNSNSVVTHYETDPRDSDWISAKIVLV